MLPILVLSVLAAVAPLAPLRVVHRFEAVGRYAAGDRGVDLAGVPGQTVVSATAGAVLFAGPVAGVGVVSVGLGDGRRLTYEPVVPSVGVGARLAAGDPVGRLTVGRANCPAPACLHWGLVTGRGPTVTYADPLTLLGRTRVRLLPLTGPPRPDMKSLARRVTLPSAAPRSPAPPSAAPRVASAPTTDAPPRAATGPVGARSRTVRPPLAGAAAPLAGVGVGSLLLGGAYARRRGRASWRAHGP